MRTGLRRARRSARDESGFTLAELLVALTIQGLIMGALAMAFVAIMRGTGQVNQSLGKTGDARIAAQYIMSDARNSSGPEISLSDTTSCPDPSPPVAGTATAVVRFNWNTTNSNGSVTPNIVNYVKVSNSLLRRQCVNGSLVSDRAVASSVQAVSPTCSPTANCSGTPTTLTVTVTETADSNGSFYSYTLSTTFRKLLGDGAPANPKSLILLGAGTTCSGTTNTIDIQGGGTLRVFGDAYINSANGASCKSMYLANGGAWSAGNTNILSGGSCNGSGCPTTTSYSPAITDPWAAKIAAGTLTAPSTGGTSRSGCSVPGYYPNGLNITSGTCTLASGTYVVQNGFSVSNGASVATGSGGVFIYLLSGQFSIGSANSVVLTAMTSGQYAGLALWQAAADTQSMIIGNGAQTVNINGAVYAPKAQLVINGGVQPKITSLVVQTINITNGITLSVGAESSSPLAITGPADALTTWTVNRFYDDTIEGDGGDGIYTWSVTGLPSGMSVDPDTGEVSGTPTSSGTYSGTVTLRDQLGDIPATASYTFTVKPAPTVATTSLPNAEKTVYYSTTLSGSNGATPYTWAATGLPAGLSINSSSGLISGTPTGTGTSTVNVTLTDVSGATATKSLSLVVVNGPPAISTASLAAATNSVAYSATMAASGGSSSYTWSASGLPAGLSINSGTGVISGTPTGSGTSSVNVTVTDSLGGTDTNPYSLVVKPAISSVVLANKTGGVAGQIEAGDTVTIVFSATMKVSSFCSAWTSGDANNQSITADNNVTVSVSNGTSPTNDALTVTSTSCTFNFGSLNLGSASFVSAAATFKGTSTNASTITWTASTKTLVIKLGAKTAGTMATVGSVTPIYTASGSVQDTAGQALGNSPFTVPAGTKF